MPERWFDYKISGEGTRKFWEFCKCLRNYYVPIEDVPRDVEISLRGLGVVPGYEDETLNKNMISTREEIPSRIKSYLEERFKIELIISP